VVDVPSNATAETFELLLKVSLINYPDVTLSDPFNVTVIERVESVAVSVNELPFLTKAEFFPEFFELDHCPEVDLIAPAWSLQMGEAMDPDSDEPVAVDINFGAAQPFLVFYKWNNLLLIKPNSIVLTGNFTIEMKLTDIEQGETSYTTELRVRCPSNETSDNAAAVNATE